MNIIEQHPDKLQFSSDCQSEGPLPVLAVVVPNSPLQIIVEINEQHRLAKLHAAETIKHAVRCGELLLQQKKLLPHGEFTRWVEQNCEFSARSARAYMQVTENFQNGSALPFSSIRQALLPAHHSQKKVDSDDGGEFVERVKSVEAPKTALDSIKFNAHAKKKAALAHDGRPSLIITINDISDSLSVFYSSKDALNLNFNSISSAEAVELAQKLQTAMESMKRLHKSLTKRIERS